MFIKVALLKITQENLQQLQQEADQLKSQYYTLDSSLTPEQLEAKAKEFFHAYYNMRKRYGYEYDPETWKIFNSINSDITRMKDEAIIRRGRTIYNGDDVYTIGQVVKEYLEDGDIHPNNIEVIMKDLRRLINNLDYWGYIRRNHKLSPQEIMLAQNTLKILEDQILRQEGIDRNSLSDPEKWSFEPGVFKKSTDLRNVIEEYPILTFVADKENGISMFAELGDMTPEEARISSEFQKQELQKFLNDVLTILPSTWNKQIVNVGNEGDFGDLISGKISSDVKLFRMMSPNEYEIWLQGEPIPVGKFFATNRYNASGTDFGNEGYREVYRFIANRSAFRGDLNGNLVSIVPLRLNGKRLEPIGDMQIQNTGEDLTGI